MSIEVIIMVVLGMVLIGMVVIGKHILSGSEDNTDITFEDLADAAGKGQNITLTPDQCSDLYRQYRQQRINYRVK